MVFLSMSFKKFIRQVIKLLNANLQSICGCNVLFFCCCMSTIDHMVCLFFSYKLHIPCMEYFVFDTVFAGYIISII